MVILENTFDLKYGLGEKSINGRDCGLSIAKIMTEIMDEITRSNLP